MKFINLFIAWGILLMGMVACNDEESKQLPVFTETVEFENTSMAFQEDADTVWIPVILSGFSKHDVKVTASVYMETKDTTALEDVHFRLPQKTITIPAGKSVGEIPLVVINDNDVNVNRNFRLWLKETEGAEPARISQITRITIVNEDFWPEVQFSATRYSVTEHETKLVIPLTAVGIFYQPMDVNVKVTDENAVQGVNYQLSKTSFHFEETARDSIVVTIPYQTLTEDLAFNLGLEVVNGGLTGKNKSARVAIRQVIKIVKFAQPEFPVLSNTAVLQIPVWFSGVRSTRDVSATVRLANAGGLNPGDYTLEDATLTCKGDTLLYARLRLHDGVSLPDVPLVFELGDVVGGELDEAGKTIRPAIKAAEKVDPKEMPWEVLSWTTEEPSGEGANNGRAIHMIDDDMGTFWHSHWSGGQYDDAPFELVVDMGEEIEIGKIGLYRRQPDNGDARKVTVEMSVDKEVWEGAIEFDFTAGGLTENGLLKELPASVTGRYLRVTVTECRDNQVASIAELTVWGLRHD